MIPGDLNEDLMIEIVDMQRGEVMDGETPREGVLTNTEFVTAEVLMGTMTGMILVVMPEETIDAMKR